nr:MAG TPA: hypothetical protein [Caudoviricetes sp.]
MNGVRVLYYHKYACPFNIYASLLGLFAAPLRRVYLLNWARSYFNNTKHE